MEQQKVFPTACFGFDKKVVLDYIYEQDTAAKAKEAELEQRASGLEEQIAELSGTVEELNAQCELIKAQLYSEKEAAAATKASYEKLKSDADQLVQVARNKDNELQIQLELNKQLQNRNTELENRLAAMTQELEEARSAPSADGNGLAEQAKAQAEALLEAARREAQAIREKAAQELAGSEEAARLRDELARIKESVGKTLAQFEGEISRLDGGEAPKAEAGSPKEEETGRFFTKESGPHPEAGRLKVKVRR